MEKSVAAKRLTRWVLLLGVCILASGCVKNKVLIKVKPDGSGNIIVTRIFSKEMVTMFEAQMEEMKKQMAARGMPMGMELPDDPFYNEDALKKEAGQFGPGVSFVRAKKYEKAGARGSIALYVFEDINDIFVNLNSMGAQPQMGMMGSMESDDEIHVAEKQENAFEFQLVKGPVNKLKIIIPDYPEKESTEDEVTDDGANELDKPAFGSEAGPGGAAQMQMMTAYGNPYGFTGNETQGEVMKRMLKGMLMSLSIEVVGTDVKSNASYARKTKKGGYRCILFEMDMDKMMTSPKGMKMMESGPFMGMAGSDSPADFFASTKDVPGIRFETNKNLVIQFK